MSKWLIFTLIAVGVIIVILVVKYASEQGTKKALTNVQQVFNPYQLSGYSLRVA